MKPRKLLSTLLALAMVLGLFVVMPITASAAGGTATWNDNTPPNIAAWTGTGNTITISGTPSGILTVPVSATVTIQGSITNATNGITLDIGAGATVIWKAEMSGDVSDAVVGIAANCTGTLDVAEGGLTNAANPAIKLTGSSSATTGSLFADGTAASITVTGNIESANSYGVKATNGAFVDVTGNVTASSSYVGVVAWSGARVSVCNVTAGAGVAADGIGTAVAVTGIITAADTGVDAQDGATVSVNGNIDAGDIGVNAASGAKVYFIPGTFSAVGYDIIVI